MVAPLRPDSTKLFTRENWIFIPTVSDIDAITVTEATAASAFDYTLVAFASGTDRPAATTNRPTAERRLGDGNQYESIGTTSHTGGNITYAFNSQGAALSDGKKFYEKIPEGTTGFLVNRRGVARDTTPTASHFYNAFPVEFGPSTPAQAGEGESAEDAQMAPFAITGPPAYNKQFVGEESSSSSS